MDANTITPDRHFEILADGSMIAVTFRGDETGKPVREREIVKVKKMGMADMPLLAEVITAEAKEIALLTGKDEAWVKDLDDDSFEALIEEGRRLNFTRFSKFWKRRMDLLTAMGQKGVLDAAMRKAADALAHKGGNPA
jgi:hypothetical protein